MTDTGRPPSARTVDLMRRSLVARRLAMQARQTRDDAAHLAVERTRDASIASTTAFAAWTAETGGTLRAFVDALTTLHPAPDPHLTTLATRLDAKELPP